MPGFIYTIKKLKEEFGKQNVETWEFLDLSNDNKEAKSGDKKANKIRGAYCDVSIKDDKADLAKKLAEKGLIFLGQNKQIGSIDPIILLRERPNYNICVIVEFREDYRISIYQALDIELLGTIVYYVCNNGSCYRLNHC
jgi:hypothetical protein